MPTKKIIAMSAPVKITAAAQEGETKMPAKFEAEFYTGGQMDIAGWELPVVIDLAGLTRGNVLVANLDHEAHQRVGNFEYTNDGKSLVAHGTATAATAARNEVVQSAAEGYQWQASLEVMPSKIETVKAGKEVQVNGQTFEGPIYVTRKGTLKGFAFVSHGADDNTSVTIAASAANSKENDMKPEVKAWAESMGIDLEGASESQLATIEANYEGRTPKPVKASDGGSPFDKRKAERDRVKALQATADRYMEMRPDDIEEIQKMYDHAVDTKMSAQEFRSNMAESALPTSYAPIRSHTRDGLDKSMLPKVLEAAVCMAGRLEGHEKMYDERILEAADQKFRNIRLSTLFFAAAEANGYQGRKYGEVTVDVQRAAFGMLAPRRMQMADGFSTVNISNVVSNLANKFLHEGWMAVDMTPMSVAAIRNVNDFKQITTVSLTGDLQFTKIGSTGEIKHGTVADLTYNNKVDTYAAMLQITRQDIINDDLGALTQVPRRLGRGGALKLNDIFWTVFLNNSSFFTSGNSNVNTGVADATNGGIAATETIFLNQTDPDSKPLGITPKIILCPTALKWAMEALVDPSGLMITGANSTIPNVNVFRGKFQVLSSPYMSNSAYTGYSAVAWYMLASPQEMPVIEIAALNGRVEPIVESADAEFDVLGVQMRGYSDIGVALQEYRGGVQADGGSS